MQILGRIQSREYVKKISETETQKRIAYEVSVSKLECVGIRWKMRKMSKFLSGGKSYIES